MIDFGTLYPDEEDINLITVGRIHEAKNQECMLQAVLQLNKHSKNPYLLLTS